jgi:hypothetical protein
MQHTALPGRNTTSRTRNGGYLFGREFALLHSERMQLHAVANLYKSGHCLALGGLTPIPDLSDYPAYEDRRFMWCIVSPICFGVFTWVGFAALT